MADPRDKDDIEPAFGSIPVPEKYLIPRIEFLEGLVNDFNKTIKEKDTTISNLNSEINKLKEEIFNLKLRLAGPRNKQKPIQQSTSEVNIEKIIKTRPQAMIFHHLLEKGSLHYEKIADLVGISKEHTNKVLRHYAEPLVRDLGGGMYAVIEDFTVQQIIRERIEHLVR